MADRMVSSLWTPDKRYPSGSGVYVIRCIANNRLYIGSSSNLAVRLSRHFTMLRGGRHENKKLQRHYDKYGDAAFECDLLELAESGSLDEVEQKWIDHYWPTRLLINCQRKAGRPPKFDELPPDVRERKREKHRRDSTGRQASPRLFEALAKRTGPNNPNFGTKWPADRVEAMRQRMRENGNPNARACIRTSPSGCVQEFKTATEASIATGVSLASISMYCHGKSRPRDGSVWRYVA